VNQLDPPQYCQVSARGEYPWLSGRLQFTAVPRKVHDVEDTNARFSSILRREVGVRMEKIPETAPRPPAERVRRVEASLRGGGGGNISLA